MSPRPVVNRLGSKLQAQLSEPHENYQPNLCLTHFQIQRERQLNSTSPINNGFVYDAR